MTTNLEAVEQVEDHRVMRLVDSTSQTAVGTLSPLSLGGPLPSLHPALSITSCALILSTATFTLRGVALMCRSRSQQGRRRVDKLVGVVQTFDVNLEAQAQGRAERP